MIALALLACQKEPEEQPLPRDFPEDFAWGTATAGFQVEMGCPTWSEQDCPIPPSDWAQWVSDPSIVSNASLHVSGQPLSDGPGMWELFEQDVARMEADGMTAYRMSLEWARLFPDPATEAATTLDALSALADPAATARYHSMFEALRQAGMTPVVTLNHYVLPLWVHDGVACRQSPETCPSGWVDRDRIVPLISLYAGWCAREFGAEVDLWFTLNEPMATVVAGYVFPSADRSAPPGTLLAIETAIAVLQNQIDGHAAMVDAIRAADTEDADGDGLAQQVGVVMNFVDITPADPDSELDQRAVQHADYLYHALYLDAMTTGAWDDNLDGLPDRTRPELAGKLDVLGINYYNELVVKGLSGPMVAQIPALDFSFEFSWDPHPEGLGDVIERGAAWGAPIWITENGTPHVEAQGVEILEGHLQALAGQLREGREVKGYLYWSYVDNYEWNHGFDLRFGLYALDPVTKERIARPVLSRYREIVASGRL